jgi:hypothetical protein
VIDATKQVRELLDKYVAALAKVETLAKALTDGLSIVPYLTGLSEQTSKEREQWITQAREALREVGRA